MNKMSAFGDWVIEAGWLVLAAGLPLCFSPWGRNPFELPKALLLWAVVGIMGAARLTQRQERNAGSRQNVADNLAHRVGTMTLIFATVLILVTILSANPLQSIQGSYDRMQGVITLLCYLALFLLVAIRLREPSQVHRLLATIAWGSAPVVVYGLSQMIGLDPLDWRGEGSPASSTLGRSNFLGAYLVLVLPLTVAGAWQEGERIRRAAYGVLIGAQLACLLATQAQAAWLGALAAGGVLVLAVAWKRGHRRLAMTGTVIGVAGMLAGPAVLFLIPGLEGSIGARVTIWRATLSLIATQPVLGHGPEMLGQVFTTVFPPELVYLQGRGVLVDRAHNLFLDTLVSTGAMGVLAYTALVGTTLVAVVRAFVQDPNHRTYFIKAAGLAAVVGHLVETQFSFPVTTTAVLFWIALGTLVTPWGESLAPLIPDSNEVTRIRWPRRFFAVTLLLTVLPTSLVFLAADTRAGDADRTSTLFDLQHSIVAARQATALWPGQPVYHKHLSWLHLQRARRGHDSPAEFRAAEAALNTARELIPGDYLVWTGYGELYVAWGQADDPVRFTQAEGAYRQAVALFPGSAMLHTGWGLVYVAQGRLAEAEAQFHQAVALDHTDAWAYTHLGDVLLARGDLTGAEEAYHNALRWAPDMIGAHRGLGHIYRHRGWIEGALIAYQSALDLAPNDPDLHLDVALCHWNLGQRELACQIAERWLQMAPQHLDLLTLHSECIK